jgi:hypothetical protein
LQIVLKVLECGFYLNELDVELPQLGRVSSAQIGARQVATFTPSARLAWVPKSRAPAVAVRPGLDFTSALGGICGHPIPAL